MCLNQRRRRLAFVSALGLCGFGCLLGGVIIVLPPPEVTRRLPDGSELTLEGITRGKTTFHLLEMGGLRERFLRLLPGWALERAGFSKGKLECDDPNALVFWMSGGTEWFTNLNRLVVQDEHGCEYPLDSVIGSASPPSRGTIISPVRSLHGCKLKVRSGRSRTLILRIYEEHVDQSRTVLAEFPAWNPRPVAPTLAAKALPAVEEIEGSEIILREFQTGLARYPREQPQPAGPDAVPWSRIRFELTGKALPTNDWQIQGLKIIDGQGEAIAIRNSISSSTE